MRGRGWLFERHAGNPATRLPAAATQVCEAPAMKGIYKRIRSFADGETSRLARRVLFAFVLTFILSRVIVLLIMSRKIPLMYLYFRGTHVHHLNYDILLLTVTCGYLLFANPHLIARRRAALVYRVALALTFDAF